MGSDLHSSFTVLLPPHTQQRKEKVAKARGAVAKSQGGFKLLQRRPSEVTGETSQSADLGRLREEARPREE
eukprot:34418-Eustigmatos_ZCMA.PRE.1